MQFIRHLFKFFFYHHVFMAVCAAMLCLQTFIFLNNGFIDYLLVGFIFAATLFSYNMHFLLASAKSNSSEQLSWFRQTHGLTIIVITLASAATLFCLIYLKAIIYYIIAAVLLNASYTAPLLFKKSLKLPLLLTLIKSYFVGFTWAFATVVLPLAFIQKEITLPAATVFAHRFMLVSVATLLFDYRDKSRDLHWGVLTPSNLLNEKQFDLFFAMNVLLFTFSAVMLVVTLPSPWQSIQLLPCIYMWWLYRHTKKRTDDLFYLSWVDGSLFLSAILSLFLMI